MTEESKEELKAIRDFRKLVTDVHPIDIYTKTPTGLEDKVVPVKAFIRALTYTETLHVRQTVLEQYSFAEEHKLTDETASRVANETALRYTVYYAVRDGHEASAPRLFFDEREVLKLPLMTILDIYTKYQEYFEITNDDLGESLRARTSGTK